MDDHQAAAAELSDEMLIEQVVQSDVTAFTLLYDRYAPPIYAMASHMLGRADAEEIVQEGVSPPVE